MLFALIAIYFPIFFSSEIFELKSAKIQKMGAELTFESELDMVRGKIDSLFLKLENVIEGVFMITERLYGLSFEEVFDVDKYHPEVKTYRIYDSNNKFVSLFYADFHPREGKRAGAWMTSFKPQFTLNNKNEKFRRIKIIRIITCINTFNNFSICKCTDMHRI